MKSVSKGEVVQLGPNGPMRRFSKDRLSGGWTPYVGNGFDGYAGVYVCASCGADSPMGVYGPSPDGWKCGKCYTQAARTIRKTKRENGSKRIVC